jgi:hypothetical protein
MYIFYNLNNKKMKKPLNLIADLLRSTDRRIVANATTIRNNLTTKIRDWKVNHARIVATRNTEAINDSLDLIAPDMFQAKIGNDIPVGFYIHKGVLNEAINGIGFPMPSNTNSNAWDFLVCYVGLEDNPIAGQPQLLRNIVYFYKGANIDGEFVPDGLPVETLVLTRGPGGGGGVAAISTPPPTH